jgi:hypothetical protein
MYPRAYALLLLACAVCVAGGAALVNWHADPYGLWHATVTPEAYRPNAIILDERTAKILRARRDKADIVLLGTSRTAVGLDPRDPAFAGKRVYNLGFGGQSLRETRVLLERVVLDSGAKEVYIGLDFFAANVHFTGKEALTVRLASAPLASAMAETAVSWQTINDSTRIIRGELSRSKQAAARYDSTTGALRWSSEYVHAQGGHRAMFAANELAYVTDNYRPAPSRAFALESPALRRDAAQEFRLLLRAAYRHGIRLHLFISPSHARQWTTLASLGLWDQFEQWKTMLVQTAEEEAKAYGQAPFPLWDFADYSTPTLEPVPDAGTIMQGYWDSSHYRPELGSALLKRMREGVSVEQGFGSRLTSMKLRSHLDEVRTRRSAYESSQPSEVREITELVRRVMGVTGSGPARDTGRRVMVN